MLPGAFSAYRWKALRGEPLNQYFLLEEIPFREVEPAIANMYLVSQPQLRCHPPPRALEPERDVGEEHLGGASGGDCLPELAVRSPPDATAAAT